MIKIKTGRKPLTELGIAKALKVAEEKLNHRIEQKGPHGLSSVHEGLGILAEEYHELLEAVRANHKSSIRREAEDIAVAALYIIASIESGTMDW